MVWILSLVLSVCFAVHPLHVLDQVATLSGPHVTEETLVGTFTEVFDGDVAA